MDIFPNKRISNGKECGSQFDLTGLIRNVLEGHLWIYFGIYNDVGDVLYLKILLQSHEIYFMEQQPP